jgi:hypothetical protein
MINTIAFIIVGWPRRTKSYGPTYPRFCDYCNNNVYFELIKTRRWITIFWIPIIPISRANYYLVCEVCQSYGELESDDDVRHFKSLVDITEQYQMGNLSDIEYEEKIRDIEEEVWEFEYEEDVQELIVESSDESRGFY